MRCAKRMAPLLLVLAAASAGFANTYYIAPTTASPAGNDDSAGTIGAPWATLSPPTRFCTFWARSPTP